MNEEFPKISKTDEANSNARTQTHEPSTHLSQNKIAQFSGRSRISQTRRGHQPLSLQQNAIILQDFCRKMHENERDWTEGSALP